jgi:hypothetical protein
VKGLPAKPPAGRKSRRLETSKNLVVLAGL